MAPALCSLLLSAATIFYADWQDLRRESPLEQIPFQGLKEEQNEKEKQEERKTTLLCSTASTLIHTKTKISRTGGSLKVCRGLPQINNKLIFIVLSSQYPLPRPAQSQPSTPSTFHAGSSGCVQVPDTMALGQGISIYKLVCSQTGL